MENKLKKELIIISNKNKELTIIFNKNKSISIKNYR